MAQNKEPVGTFLILDISKGFGFGCLKNTLLQISAKLENKSLISEYVYTTPELDLDFTFAWQVPVQFLKRLQSSRSNIEINVWAVDQSQNRWRVGYALLGVQRAQFANWDDSLRHHCLQLYGTKTKFGIRIPELVVTLSVQASPRLKAKKQLYSTQLGENVEDAEGTAQIICDSIKSDTQANKHSKKKQKGEFTTNTMQTPEIQNSRDMKKLENPGISPKTSNLVTSSDLSDWESSELPEDYTDFSDKSSATLSTSEETKNSRTVVHHFYALDIHIESIKWYKVLKNMKVLVRFYNPVNNSMVTVKKDKEFYMPDLVLSDVICGMRYICRPTNLIKTVLRHPPHILICKASNNKVIAKGRLKFNLKAHSKKELLMSYMPLVTKSREVIGKISSFIQFQDLGRVSRRKRDDSLKCVVRFKKHGKDSIIGQANIIKDIISNIEKLAKVHEQLTSMHSKVRAGFQKIVEKHVLEHISKHKLSDENELAQHSILKEIHHKIILSKPPCTERHANKQISFLEKTRGRNENICAKYNVKREKDTTVALQGKPLKGILKETSLKQANGSKKNIEENCKNRQSPNIKLTTEKPDVSVIKNELQKGVHVQAASVSVTKHMCEGCKQYLEIGFSSNVWQDSTLAYWCKDCKIKKIQADLKETLQNCSTEISDLKNYITKLENEYQQHAGNFVSKEKYDHLCAAQHHLTMLIVYAKIKNEILQMKCSEAIEEMNMLKQNEPGKCIFNKFAQNGKKSGTRELWKEVDVTKKEDILTQQINANNEKQRVATHQSGEANTVKSSSRRDRCEACQVLQKRAKTVSSTANRKSKIQNTAQQSGDSLQAFKLREKMAKIHIKLQQYLEERDKLLRLNHYTCDDIVVSYMTHAISKLLTAWYDLKIELGNLVHT